MKTSIWQSSGFALSSAILLYLGLADFRLLPVQAAPAPDNSLQVPNRRKPGASRPSTEVVEAPMRRKPGASREAIAQNQCRFNPQQLTALIPPSLSTATASANPTLFFAVPSIPSHTSLELVLRNGKDELVYEQTFPGVTTAGILPIALPSHRLDSQQQYHWYLSVICNPSDRAHDLVLEGLIQRVELDPSVQQKLTQANPEERVALYQSHQLWQDEITTLVNLKQSHPQDSQVLKLWQESLKVTELDNQIESLPILPVQNP